MRIGEPAERTNVATRLLRYYEEQGLLEPDRTENGYRDHPESIVERVVQIRGLFDSGVTGTRSTPTSTPSARSNAGQIHG